MVSKRDNESMKNSERLLLTLLPSLKVFLFLLAVGLIVRSIFFKEIWGLVVSFVIVFLSIYDIVKIMSQGRGDFK